MSTIKPTFLMIHHTAVSYDKLADQFIANNNYHKAQWNFKSSLGYYLGYNYEIAKNGKVYKAREEGERTAAAYQSDMNNGQCVHIALDGNFDIEKPAPAQIYALRDLMRDIVKRHDIKKQNIVFHRDYANKSCPGGNIEIGFIQSLSFPNETPQDAPASSDIKERIIKLVQELLDLVKKL